jgi:hypothetical protein
LAVDCPAGIAGTFEIYRGTVVMDGNGEEKQPLAVNTENEEIAQRRARNRAYAARWNLDIAVFAFSVLILVVILLSQNIGLEIVAPVAVFGLAMVWLCGWRQGRQIYNSYYEEELMELEREARRETMETVEESVEELIQKALRERWK